MSQKSYLNREAFETLLRWLDPDREIAGQKYEEIRVRLVRLFLARGCPFAEELADETIDRVTKRSVDIAVTYEGNPILYFYGVAQKVYLESRRKPREVELPRGLTERPSEIDHEELDAKFECLQQCLAKLVPAQRELIVNYYDYTGAKRDKIDRRKEISMSLGIKADVIRVRVFRIRATLMTCIKDCVRKNAKGSSDLVITD